MPTAYGYCRVSTDRQEDSVEVQQETISKYRDWRLKDFEWGGFFTDNAVSGERPLTERKAGREMCMRLQPGDCIVIAKLDRGFRSLYDLARMVRQFEEKEVALHFLDLNVDTSTEVGKLIVHVVGAVAEFERARISKRIKEVLAWRKANGKVYCKPGYGTRHSGKKHKRYALKDETELAIMAKIHEWHEAGYTYERIYWHMRKLGIKTRNGKEWSKDRIFRAHTRYQSMIDKTAAPSHNPGPDSEQPE